MKNFKIKKPEINVDAKAVANGFETVGKSFSICGVCELVGGTITKAVKWQTGGVVCMTVGIVARCISDVINDVTDKEVESILNPEDDLDDFDDNYFDDDLDECENCDKVAECDKSVKVNGDTYCGMNFTDDDEANLLTKVSEEEITETEAKADDAE